MQNIVVFSKLANLAKELRLILPSLKFQEATGIEQCKNSEIIVTDFDLLAPHVYNLPNTKWVQGTFAGLDKLMPNLKHDVKLPFTITRFSGTHFGKIMSEYVVANIVSHERNFPQTSLNKTEKLWDQSGKIGEYRIISDLTIGILGIGHIGNHIGKILNELGAKVLGFGRSDKISPKFDRDHFANYYTLTTLPELLTLSDYIVNVLPDTPETKGLLNNNILKNCKNSVFINIGRGSIINEDEIIKAIDEGWLSGVILDVFSIEPLPQDSCLWTKKEVTITPHVAGATRAKDLAEQFKINYELYLQSRPIPCSIELGKLY